MDFYTTCFSSAAYSTLQQQDHITADVKRGPWTVEEDSLLMNYVNIHGEGRWNSVARQAGLKRTGKSCRLRWLNYLRPDLRRGDMTPQEQLIILELHSRWGNKWSKIASHLSGRTDNEIKNYWRTRVQKQAKILKCDVNSKKFQDAVKCVWMPRLREQIRSGPITMDVPAIDQVVQMSQHHGFDVSESSIFFPEMSVSNSSLSLIYDLFESSSPNPVSNPTYNQWVPEYEDCTTWLRGDIEGGDNLLMTMDDGWSEDTMRFLQEQLSDNSL